MLLQSAAIPFIYMFFIASVITPSVLLQALHIPLTLERCALVDILSGFGPVGKSENPKKFCKLQESDDPKAYKNIIQILRADFFFCSSYEGRRTFNAMEIQIHCTTTQSPGK